MGVRDISQTVEEIWIVSPDLKEVMSIFPSS